MSINGKIRCSFPTAKEKQIAEKLGLNPAIVNTLASSWITKNPEKGEPTEDDIRKIWESRDFESEYLAIPVYETIPFNPSKPLAVSTKEGGIILQEVFKNNNLEYFFDYIQGKIDSPTSQQKKEVFKRLEKEGYTIDVLRELIRNKKEAYQFLLWHEMSHIQNGDHTTYYQSEREQYPNYDKMTSEEKAKVKDYMTEDKIEKEYRATLDALEKVTMYESKNPKPNTVDYRSLLIDNVHAYFEGGGQTLLDVFPNMPKEMWRKIGDYIFGQGALTQRDAKEILDYINSQLPYFIKGEAQIINPQKKNISALINGKKVQRVSTPIKDKFKGKLIFAQSGTGKTTIADNVNVIDSDYILGEILKVHTSQANTAFSSLSPKDKQKYSKIYEERIKEIVSQGKTVITARLNSLDDADIIIYNDSVEITNNRTSSLDRSNNFINSEYQTHSLNTIKEKSKGKETYVLGENQFLSDILLENPNFNIAEEYRKQFDSIESITAEYLSKFGFTIEEFNQAGYSIEYLDRILQISSPEDITEATGELIAFMSMFNATEKQLIIDMAIADGTLTKEEIYDSQGRIKGLVYRKLNKEKYFKIIGKSISEELKYQWEYAVKNHKYDNRKSDKTLIDKIRDIIKEFFNALLDYDQYKILRDYSRQQAINALSLNEFFIKQSIFKPGDENAGFVTQINLKKALDENPYEKDIIKKLSELGFALAGSAAMSVQGTIYRPAENPLHDIDFDTNGKNKEYLDKHLPEKFENIQHIRTIESKENSNMATCETYLTMSVPFIIDRMSENIGKPVIKDKNTGEVIAMFENSNLTIIKEGIKGKFLDFFVNKPSKYGDLDYDYNGEKLLISHYKNAMHAKIFDYNHRIKDIWDFNRFIPNKNVKIEETENQNINPVGTINMDYSFDNNNREGMQARTTIDAVESGERTATTRYAKHGNLDYISKFKIGDIIAFKNQQGKIVYVRVTKPLTQLSKDVNAEEWSKKEGWSVDYFNKKVKPEIDKGEAYQLEFEYVSTKINNNPTANLGKDFKMYTGDAGGADSYWISIGNQYGMNITPYKASDINDTNRQESTEKVTKAALELGRNFPMQEEYKNKLLLRNWLQIKDVDTVFAVSQFDSRGHVERGTGWTVQMAITEGKQVYLFDQNRNTWMRSTKSGGWINMSEAPKLTENSACVGTRKLKDNGKKAIRDVFEKTFGVAPMVQESSKSPNNVVRSFGPNTSSETANITAEMPNADIEALQAMMNDFDKMKSMEKDSDEDLEYINDLPEVGIEHLDKVTLIDRRTAAARAFNYTVRKDREVYLAAQFSDIITKKQEELLEQEQANLEEATANNDTPAIYNAKTKIKEYSDPETGRQRVVDTVGVLNILQEMYKEWQDSINVSDAEIEDSFGEGSAQHHKIEYQKVLDYFDILMEDAALIIESREGIRITFEHRDYNDGASIQRLLGGTTSDINQENNEEDENNDDSEQRVNNSEGWGFKVRMIDPHSTISKVVKRILGNIVKENEDGSIDTDDLGNVRYLDENHAYVVLLDGLSGMIDADDFSQIDKQTREIISLPALEKLAEKYPWVNQVINAIYMDNSIASNFYTAFRKEMISYWAQKHDQVFRLNESTRLDDSMTNTIYNYESGTRLSNLSIYNSDSTLNDAHIQANKNNLDDLFNSIYEYDNLEDDEIEDFVKKVVHLFKNLGIDTNKTIIESVLIQEGGIYELKSLLQSAKEILDKANNLKEGHLINELKSYYETINNVLGVVSESGGIMSFRSGDKSFYSYSEPNYMDSMIKSFKDDNKRGDYLKTNFQTSWFYDKRTGKYKNHWLQLLDSEPEVIAQLEMIDLNYIESDSYNPEDHYYTQWDSIQIKSGFIRQYFMAGYNSKSNIQYAWYNFPIFSDSPVAKFIKFVRYTDNYEDMLLPHYVELVKQELWRIRHVQNRRARGVSQINNYDTNGDKFHFFPELNDYIVEDTGNVFLDEVLKVRKDTNALNSLIEKAIKDIMESNFTKFLNNISGEEKNAIWQKLKQDGVVEYTDQLEEKLKEYFWNSTFAMSQIIQLTTTDLAFYKNQIDFQKRFKEVYAAGTRLNTNSKYGKQYERAIYLSDSIITSFGFDNIRSILQESVKTGHLNDVDVDFILTKYNQINVTDAQSYRTLESFRSILDMLGKWDDTMEATYERINSGTWDISDFNTIWQTIKPFVFTNVIQDDGFGGSMRNPIQHKNSEFLLMAMFEMFGGPLNKSPKLKALNQFMKDNSIDVAHFESAVKVGGEGFIDINYSVTKIKQYITEEIETAAKIELGEKKYLKASLSARYKAGNDKLLRDKKITQKEYLTRMKNVEPSEQEVYDMLENACYPEGSESPNVVHSIPYKDYMIAQPTPEHLLDTVAIFGSQFRNLIISDISKDAKFKIHNKEYSKDELLHLYQSLIVENLLEDFDSLKEFFKDTNIESLQKELIKQVKGNPKYGRDMVEALQLIEIVNPRTGQREKVFNIPLWNPSTTERFQELVNSLFKNRITKQHIKGGNCILVSDFGLTDKLNIVYNKEGDKTSGVAGIECYLPAYSKQFYEPFLKDSEDGSYQYLDIESMPKELRKLIGYRIPTEGKYSMVPLIIKGFLPQQNGSAIMLPADITTIAGSDFDVDKLFLMIPEFKMETIDWRKAREDYAKENSIFKEVLSKFTYSELAQEFLNDEPPSFKEWFNNQDKKKYLLEKPIPVKVKYDSNKEPKDNSKQARNNMLIDISYAILTHPDTSYKVLSPGNFDTIKKWARAADITTDPEVLDLFMQEYNIKNAKELDALLDKLSLDELSDFVSKYKQLPNPLSLDNFVYFHRQNMTGGTLIGMYANNTTMQSKLQHTNISILNNYSFNINGREISSLHNITSGLGELISKNCAEFSASSVDNAKDPVLASLMQNKNTARITAFLLNAGLSIKEIAYIFTTPVMRIAANSSDVGSSLKMAIKNLENSLSALGVEYRIKTSDVIKEGVTNEELLEAAIQKNINIEEMDIQEKIKYYQNNIKLNTYFLHLVSMSSEFSEFTRLCRADSPNNAVATSVAGAKNQVQNVRMYQEKIKSGLTYFSGTEQILNESSIDINASKDNLRQSFLSKPLSMLEAFYSLGISAATKLTAPYFIQNSDYVNNLVDVLFINSPNGVLSDKVLNSFYKELVIFGLTNTDLFGDSEQSSLEQKRNYYLNSFPANFKKIMAENPDLADIGIMKKIYIKDGRIVMDRSARLSQAMKDSYMRDFDSLLYSDNPVAHRLALDLFMYSFYSENLKFGPNNYGYFFSTFFLNHITEYVTSLRGMKYDMYKGSIYDNFIHQFYANHAMDNGLLPKVSSEIEKDGSVNMAKDKVINPLTKLYYPYIYVDTEGGGLFRLDPMASTKDNAVYVKDVELGNSKNPIYNARKSIEQIAENLNKESKIRYGQKEDNSEDIDKVSKDLLGIPDIDFTLEDIPSSVPEGLINLSNLLDNIDVESLVGQYNEEEGEKTLNDPLCIRKL